MQSRGLNSIRTLWPKSVYSSCTCESTCSVSCTTSALMALGRTRGGSTGHGPTRRWSVETAGPFVAASMLAGTEHCNISAPPTANTPAVDILAPHRTYITLRVQVTERGVMLLALLCPFGPV